MSKRKAAAVGLILAMTLFAMHTSVTPEIGYLITRKMDTLGKLSGTAMTGMFGGMAGTYMGGLSKLTQGGPLFGLIGLIVGAL